MHSFFYSLLTSGSRGVSCIGTLLLFMSLPLFSGCAAPVLEKAAWRDQRIDIVWPQPPQRSRIRLERLIGGPTDVVNQSGTAKKLFNLVTEDYSDKLEFYTPQGIAADAEGRIWIADPSLGVVHKYDLAAGEIEYIFEIGDSFLSSPAGIARDSSGNMYVTDTDLRSVFKFNPSGVYTATISHEGFSRPLGIAVGPNGEKVVTDMLAHKLFVFDSSDRFVRVLPGPDFEEKLNMPSHVAIDRDGFIYTTDSLNFKVRVFSPAGKHVRSFGKVGDSPGSFARPKGIALDSDKNIYVIDALHGNFQIFNQQGQLLLYVAQDGTRPGEFMLPTNIFIDRHDRIYVADTFNHRIQIFQYLKDGRLN